MYTFAQHYYLQEKLSSDIRRALTANLFKKRKVGVDLGRGKYKIVIEAEARIFAEVLDSLQSGAKAFFTGQKEKRALFGFKKKGGYGLSATLKKLSGTDIKGVYEGEIDSGENKIQGNPISSLVFEVQNGAKIAFITTEEDENIRYYISTNTKGNDFFRENLGTTLEQIRAESIAKGINIDLKKKSKSEEKPFKKEPTEEYPEDEEEPEENEYGIMDISLKDMNNIESDWGDGKKGLIKGGSYEFKNKFKKERRENFGFNNNYDGYKYFDSVGNAVYLIDMGDGKNASIGFKDKSSYNWAKRIGLLNIWKLGSIDSRIHWENGNIENLP